MKQVNDAHKQSGENFAVIAFPYPIFDWLLTMAPITAGTMKNGKGKTENRICKQRLRLRNICVPALIKVWATANAIARAWFYL